MSKNIYKKFSAMRVFIYGDMVSDKFSSDNMFILSL